MNENVHVITHPMVQHKLAKLRDTNTTVKEFRECLQEMSGLLGYEATRDLPVKQVSVETPLGMADCSTIEGKTLALVPILRGGLGMADGILQFIPVAKVGHMGLYRDPVTLQIVQYYCKMPSDINEREALILDPVVATGAKMLAAIQILKNYKCKSIKVICTVISEQAAQAISSKYPEIQVYCAAVDPSVTEDGTLVPGIGDAGDREFGTK